MADTAGQEHALIYCYGPTTPQARTICCETCGADGSKDDGWKCGHYHSDWDAYTKGVDWAYYANEEGDCESCKRACEADPSCTGIECGLSFFLSCKKEYQYFVFLAKNNIYQYLFL